ncbi:MAG: heavy metal translocating P-type ATPase [Bifidobacteriaceae bacterium]|jgi:Cu2+-exporting ATPase|nr:heavy metal translocating P-type ATPase [Bifidobacteriaceae bacterium]
MKDMSFRIEGMHCVSCARSIEKKVSKISGLKNKVRVNFPAKMLFINLDSGYVKKAEFAKLQIVKSQIIETVAQAGYKATFINDVKGLQNHESKTVKIWQKRIIMAVICCCPILFYMILDIYKIRPVSDFSLNLLYIMPYMGLVSLIIGTFCQFYLAIPFYKGAWRALRGRTSNMNTLIALGTSVAYLYSLYNYVFYIYSHKTFWLVDHFSHNLYFETSIFLISFVIFGKYLEAKTLAKTTSSISKLVELKPRVAHIFKDNKWLTIPAENIKAGNRLKVLAGEQIPQDGVIVRGETFLDESMITGESSLIKKSVDSKVIAGTINTKNDIEIVVQAVGESTLLAQIIRLVEQAQNAKSPIEDFTDKVASKFVPTVLVIAGITFLVWFFIFGAGLSRSLEFFVAVLIIACPCALGLATPTAVMVGIGQGAKMGILIRGGAVLQKLNNINWAVFDKTGTLTDSENFIKQDSKQAIELLRSKNIKTYLISGDKLSKVQKVSEELGINNFQAEVTPEDKLRLVENLQSQNQKVAMIGDGVNDAPALAKADVGISLAAGTDIANETSDVILAYNNLSLAPRTIFLARATIGKIYQNLFFSLFYNFVGIPIAAGVLISWNISLRPEFAGLAMALSSVTVVLNSLSLKLKKI